MLTAVLDGAGGGSIVEVCPRGESRHVSFSSQTEHEGQQGKDSAIWMIETVVRISCGRGGRIAPRWVREAVGMETCWGDGESREFGEASSVVGSDSGRSLFVGGGGGGGGAVVVVVVVVVVGSGLGRKASRRREGQ